MDLQYLCTNCLTGTLRNGVCTYCHKRIHEIPKNPANALPARYMLGSQYYLGKVIGNGGFGITYLAWDCIEQRRVIVKELYPRQDVQRDQAGRTVIPLKGQEDYYRKLKQRFKEEAEILYSFRHEPSVMNVYRLMEDNNTVYYSMEYLSGFDLKTYMEQQGKLGWPQLSGYIRKILYTLQILHGQGLIHRDISPDNIFLTSVMDAKLIDFGSVRNYNSGQGLTTILKQVYAPVEQYFTNGAQGPWTDIYALSVTMYHAPGDGPRGPGRGHLNRAALPGASGACGPGHHQGNGGEGGKPLPERGGDGGGVVSGGDDIYPGEAKRHREAAGRAAAALRRGWENGAGVQAPFLYLKVHGGPV